MKNARSLAFALLLAAGCRTALPPAEVSVSSWQGELESWGTLREALRDGEVQGRVALADVARRGVYAVGALENLDGEVTIADGEVWISVGGAEHPITTRARTTDARATLLFAAEVEEWNEIAVEEPVAPSELDAFLAERARAVGLDPARPFPFVVEGGLFQLDMHVIAGECPKRARMLGEEVTSPPYELHVDRLDGRLVGIYAEDSAVIVSHGNSNSHVHALLERPGPLTGHAEAVGLAAGSLLKLPRR